MKNEELAFHSQQSVLSLRGLARIARTLQVALAAYLTASSTAVMAQGRGGVSLNCQNVVAEAKNPSGTVVAFQPKATTTSGFITSIQCSPASGSVFPLGVTVVKCVAVDSFRNSDTCSFTVTVRDTTPPEIHTAPVLARCASQSGAVVNFAVRTADNASESVRVLCTPASGSLFPIGTNKVVCVAGDEAGNLSTNEFPVIVSTECADCLHYAVPSETITVDADASGKQVVFFRTGVLNVCGGSAWEQVDPPSGSVFPFGKTTVTYRAGIGVEALVTKTFDVVVRDATPPRIVVPGRLEYPCGGYTLNGSIVKEVWYPEIRVTDNVDFAPDLTLNPPSGSTMTLGEHVVIAIAKDFSGNVSSNQFVVVVVPGPKCQVDMPEIPEAAPDNWGFELGLVSWTKTGQAFENQPTFEENLTAKRIYGARTFMEEKIGGDYWRDLTYPIGIKGAWSIATAEDRPQNFLPQGKTQGDAPRGTLHSKIFTLDKDYVSFLIGGSYNADVRVELLAEVDKGTPDSESFGTGSFRVRFKASPKGEEVMQRQWFEVTGYKGRRAILRIVDDSPAGHINVDDFRFTNIAPLAQTVRLGDTVHPAVVSHAGGYYDWDAPVWGIVDMHTHPMSHLGFREKIMHGQPDGDIKVALGDCRCTHGGYGPDNTCGDYVRQLLFAVMDGAGPAPHGDGWNEDQWRRFRNFPVFSTKVHQQMWHEWITRAYQGGLRTMVALCVNSQLLGHAAKGDGPELDKEVGDMQIDELKSFVARHSDIMEIALDPIQLRSIVRSNKLAIIIGSELDDIGNFVHDPSVSAYQPTAEAKQKVTDEIKRLHAKGLRYLFPTHLTDNKFGGTAIAGDLLNVASKYMNGFEFGVEAAGPLDLIDLKLSYLDFTKDVSEILGDLQMAAPALPVLLPLLAPVADVMLSEKLGPVPPGTSVGVGLGLGAFGVMSALGAPVMEMAGLDSIPPNIWPIGGNFSKPPYTSIGHRNKRGLTPLGEHAIREMMKLGIMIDMDHMSRHMCDSVLKIAENAPGGYPINSGHNSFSILMPVDERGENGRTRDQAARIRELGGLMGVGWENHNGYGFETTYFDNPVLAPEWSISNVENNCAGSSRTWAQDYLLAREPFRGRQIGLGTDINGIIMNPSPRFGPQAAFPNESWYGRHKQITAQRNGVLYEPKYGRPITSSVMAGRAVDPQGSDIFRELQANYPADYEKGYSYNIDQRNFLSALNIFHWKPTLTDVEIQQVTQALHDDISGVDKANIGYLVMALRASASGQSWETVRSTERVCWVVHQYVTGHPEAFDLPWIQQSDLKHRFRRLRRIWDEYEAMFGNNIPLKRCETRFKQWDVNLEGVAHYGMLPDFLQDLHNVGLDPQDMSTLFQSSEDFARMWTRCLRVSFNIIHPPIHIEPKKDPSQQRVGFTLNWFGETGDVVEYTDTLSDAASWKPYKGPLEIKDGSYEMSLNDLASSGGKARFFRIVKPN